MAASYTLQSNGLAVRSDTGTITQEWWTASPTETDNIGNFFQARALITESQTTKISGTIGEWISLNNNQSWSVDSGGIILTIQIRRTFTDTILDSATIQLGLIDNAVDGTYFWILNEPEFFRYGFNAAGFGLITTPISLAIGDTVTFEAEWVNNQGADDVIISSSSGAANIATFGLGTPSTIFKLVGYTATINGDTLNDGDSRPVIDSNEAAVIYTFVLTATVATDIEIITADSSGSNGSTNAIFNLTVNSGGTEFNWPMDEFETDTLAEVNFGSNDMVIQSFAASLWRNAPYVLSSGDITDHASTLQPYIAVNESATYLQPSLRIDDEDFSIRYGNGSSTEGRNNATLFIPYASGFTVETIVEVNAIANGGSSNPFFGFAGYCIDAGTAFSLWVMRFDNFGNALSATTFPVFTLIGRDENYIRPGDNPGKIENEIRSDIETVLGNTYHFLATIRPSNNTIEFWINGASVGSASIPSGDSWFNPGPALDNLLDGSKGTFINLGASFISGASRVGGDSVIDNTKIHLLEADDAFAAQQAVQANFTT